MHSLQPTIGPNRERPHSQIFSGKSPAAEHPRVIRFPARGAPKVDGAAGMAIVEAMSRYRNFRDAQGNKLVLEPPIVAPDEHAQLVEADQRFQAALEQAIAAGGERKDAVEATVTLKQRRRSRLTP